MTHLVVYRGVHTKRSNSNDLNIKSIQKKIFKYLFTPNTTFLSLYIFSHYIQHTDNDKKKVNLIFKICKNNLLSQNEQTNTRIHNFIILFLITTTKKKYYNFFFLYLFIYLIANDKNLSVAHYRSP